MSSSVTNDGLQEEVRILHQRLLNKQQVCTIIDHLFVAVYRLSSHFFGSLHVVLNFTTQHNTTVLLLFWNMSRTTRVSRRQKGKTRKVKTNLDLPEQETVSGSGICRAICNAYSLRPPARSPPCGRYMGSPPIVHTRRVPPCMAQSRLGAFPR